MEEFEITLTARVSSDGYITIPGLYVAGWRDFWDRQSRGASTEIGRNNAMAILDVIDDAAPEPTTTGQCVLDTKRGDVWVRTSEGNFVCLSNNNDECLLWKNLKHQYGPLRPYKVP